ncbi:WD40 repeat-containing protein [Heterostelium album PN500]|uniref:methylated diphthine methylhydrolase n=1 Tax=Heterostelium pallidum (strain ATCC 26659 / Pp 5 / PN500) TaxID=670386 RepID=D3BRN9_HETP5|nr:WD40 repeat-containing protein [Heterostelium album PN500]EFA76071.1 WD40 repeat-containing protein [Heterostelium album PN500]|eukprot:XP_020428205.1 WD40 repeat-containing protein [Heterostelium album PN500]
MTSVTLELSADSVECHPSLPNLMAVGTYQIDQEHNQQYKDRRSGKLYLFDVEIGKPSPSSSPMTCTQLQEIEFNSGILDMKWTKTDQPKLGVVLSRGDLAIYRVGDIDGTNQKSLVPVMNATPISPSESDEILALSLDWNKSGTRIITSFSNGSLALFDVDNDKPETIERWDAHGYEAWIAAFYYHQEQLMFSGGDDCLWKHWDSRVGLSTPTITKRCDMGVTSIHCHPHRENIVAVGSYDENLRVWDLRSMRSPVSTTALGGGVWRVKWHPSSDKQDQLVTACMGGAFNKLTFNNELTSADIETYNGQHQSIAYGVDWSSSSENQYIGCCSFYDKLLSIWS